MKATELVKQSDFTKFYFYGKDKLPATKVYKTIGKSTYIHDFDNINWDNVEKFENGYYNYSKALTQIYSKASAEYIAYVFDKVLGMKAKCICHDNDTLYICIE